MPRRRKPLRTSRQLYVERLEDRQLLATFTVSNLLDGPVVATGDLPGSLRQAIFDARASDGADTIDFTTSGTIPLTAGELTIDDHLTISGPGADLLVIDAAHGADGLPGSRDGTRIFNIDNGDEANLLNVVISGLTLTGGDGTGPGGAIFSREQLTVTDSTVTGNSTSGRASKGGGIYSDSAQLTVSGSTVSGNTTTGDVSHGGGIYGRYAELHVTGSTISGNSVLGADSNGGGVASYRGNVQVAESTVSHNSTTVIGRSGSEGGGIFIREADLVVTGSTITGNSAPGGAPNVAFGPRSQRGGGIHSYYGNVSVTDSTVSNNSATQGGGILNFNGDLLITRSTISGNSTEGEQSLGGGIYNGQDGTLTITGSTVSGNSVSGYFSGGGGIWNFVAPVMISNSIVTGNSTSGEKSSGGGIASFGYGLSIVGSTISGNSTHGNSSYGGGITFQGFEDDDEFAVNSTTITGNSTTGELSHGGGIWVLDASFKLTESTVSGNSTTGTDASGGGIWVERYLDGPFITTISNSTISGNSTNTRGGGVYNKQGLVVIEYSTITGNSAPAGEGSGVASYGDETTRTEVAHSIIAANGLSDVDSVAGEVNSFQSGDYNLIGTGSAAGSFDETGDQTGVPNPRLGPLASNGGPTPTHALLPGSPALDAGDPLFASPPNFDQRGSHYARVADGGSGADHIDIGAYESQGEPSFNVADYNQNGIVDAADYTLWRNTMGSDVDLRADGNGNLVIDDGDYEVWKTNFGSTIVLIQPAVAVGVTVPTTVDIWGALLHIPEQHATTSRGTGYHYTAEWTLVYRQTGDELLHLLVDQASKDGNDVADRFWKRRDAASQHSSTSSHEVHRASSIITRRVNERWLSIRLRSLADASGYEG